MACSTAHASDPSSLFDKPLHEIHIPLPHDPYNPQAKPMLSCFYYPHLMVKQVDMGEEGAEELSLTHIRDHDPDPPCRRANSKNEIVIHGQEWGGYVKGVKGEYVFFDAQDGWNGGLGFAVYDSGQGTKIFEDVALSFSHINLLPSQTLISQDITYDTPLILTYERVYLAPCSLKSETKTCWDRITQETGLSKKEMPDCRASYEAEEKRTLAQNQQVATDPSILYYDVEVVLDNRTSTVIRISPTSKVLACLAAE